MQRKKAKKKRKRMKKEVDGNDEDVEAERKTSRLKGITQPKKLSTILSLDFVGSSNFPPPSLPPVFYVSIFFLSTDAHFLIYFTTIDTLFHGIQLETEIYCANRVKK